MRVFKYMLISAALVGLDSCASFKDMIGGKVNSVTPAVSSNGDKSGKEKQETGGDRAMQRFFSKKSKKAADKAASDAKTDGNARNAGSQTLTSAPAAAATGPAGGRASSPATASRADAPETTLQAEYNAISEHLNGEWMFDNAYGKGVPGEDDRPSLYFDASKNRFYAYNGCNYINGDYIIGGKSSITFSNQVATQDYCADMPQSSEISALIKQTRYFNLTTLRQEEYLELMNERHQKIGTLHRHCLEALNGMWEVAEIRGQKISRTNAPTIVIDLPEKRVHGHSGCNLFTGSIYQDPDKEQSVQFQGMRVPKRENSPSTWIQTMLLVALEQVEKAYLDGDLRAVLCDEDDNPLIVLIRTE